MPILEPIYSTAQDLAGRQRGISVWEIFLKNCQLLDSNLLSKVLLSRIRKAAGNALDACRASQRRKRGRIHFQDMLHN